MITAPPDPEEGGDILEWAAQMTTLTRQLIGRESADIIPEITSTGTRYRLRRQGGAGSPAGPGIKGFTLIDKSVVDEHGHITTKKARVVSSNLGNSPPTGFHLADDPEFTLTLDSDTGVVFARVTINPSTGAETSRGILKADTIPDSNPTSGAYAYQIGSWHFTAGDGTAAHPDKLGLANDAFGPISYSICPVPWTSPQTFTLTFSASS